VLFSRTRRTDFFFAKFEFNAVILKKKTHSRPAADVLGDSSEKEKSFL
jgi:hypothetical protein